MADGIMVNGTRTHTSIITDADASDAATLTMSDQLLPSLSNLTFNDIFLVGMGEYVFVVPKTAAGMIWLQTHFDQNEWDSISSDDFTE
jgi:hypothetical protein